MDTVEKRVAIIGPSERFLSGIAYYTWKMSTNLDAKPLLYRICSLNSCFRVRIG